MLAIDFAPNARMLRTFGRVGAVAFGLAALLAWRQWWLFSGAPEGVRTPLAITLAALAMASGLLSVTWPRGLRPLYLALCVVTYPIGLVISSAIMATLFFVLITPIGLLSRRLGRNGIVAPAPSSESYWSDAPTRRPLEDYFKSY